MRIEKGFLMEMRMMEAIFAVAIVGLFSCWVGQLKHEISLLAADGAPRARQPTVHRIVAQPPSAPTPAANRPAPRPAAVSNTIPKAESRTKRVSGTGIPTWTID